MPTRITDYVNTKPGLEQAGPANRFLHSGAEEQEDSFFSTTALAAFLEKECLGSIDTSDAGAPGSLNGGTSASFGYWTATYTSTGTAAFSGGNYVLTTPATSGNYCQIQSGCPILSTYLGTINQGKPQGIVNYVTKINFPANNITYASKYLFGFTNTAVDPLSGSVPTDGAWIEVSGAGIVSTKVRGASGTVAVNTTTIALVASNVVTFYVKFLRSGSNATSWGAFYVKVSGQPTIKIDFTPAQITQLNAQSASIYAVAEVATGSNNASTLPINTLYAECDQLS
jgi:hypothetical protein